MLKTINRHKSIIYEQTIILNTCKSPFNSKKIHTKRIGHISCTWDQNVCLYFYAMPLNLEGAYSVTLVCLFACQVKYNESWSVCRSVH